MPRARCRVESRRVVARSAPAGAPPFPLYFFGTRAHLLKRVLVGNVKHQQRAVGVPVVDGPERVEPLLPCRVLSAATPTRPDTHARRVCVSVCAQGEATYFSAAAPKWPARRAARSRSGAWSERTLATSPRACQRIGSGSTAAPATSCRRSLRDNPPHTHTHNPRVRALRWRRRPRRAMHGAPKTHLRRAAQS